MFVKVHPGGIAALVIVGILCVSCISYRAGTHFGGSESKAVKKSPEYPIHPGSVGLHPIIDDAPGSQAVWQDVRREMLLDTVGTKVSGKFAPMGTHSDARFKAPALQPQPILSS